MKAFFLKPLLIVYWFGFPQHQLLIGYNETLNLGKIEIKLEKVLVDSRCPKSVMCVRAGEAEVLISIFKNGKFIKNKRLITTYMGSNQKVNLVIKDNELEIYGLALHPYPTTAEAIPHEDYILELVMNRSNN